MGRIMGVRSIPLIRVSMFLPTIQFLDRLGSPVHRYLNQSKIPGSVLEIPETLVPLSMALQFIGVASHAEGINNLGIAMGQASKVSALGVFGILICQSFNLYDALQRVCHFSKKAQSASGDLLWLIEQPEQIWFCQKFIDQPHSKQMLGHSIYYTLMLMLDCIRLALGDHWEPPEVMLPTVPYSDLEEGFHLGNTRIHYGQEFTAISIPRASLSTPMHVPSSTSLCPSAHLNQAHLEEWETTAPPLGFVAELEQIVSTLLLMEYPTITMTAEASGLSVRTLQRALAQHNLSYSRLVDQVRYQKAVALLKEPDISMIEIAFALGFQYPGNFSHAFRRWSGMSPRQFRQSIASSDPSNDWIVRTTR